MPMPHHTPHPLGVEEAARFRDGPTPAEIAAANRNQEANFQKIEGVFSLLRRSIKAGRKT